MVVLRAPILLRLLIPVIGSLNYCLSFSLSAYPKPNSFCTSCWSCADKFGMDDELKEIRRRQRERWLAAQAEGRQGGDRDTSAGPTGSATASGSAHSPLPSHEQEHCTFAPRITEAAHRRRGGPGAFSEILRPGGRSRCAVLGGSSLLLYCTCCPCCCWYCTYCT